MAIGMSRVAARWATENIAEVRFRITLKLQIHIKLPQGMHGGEAMEGGALRRQPWGGGHRDACNGCHGSRGTEKAIMRRRPWGCMQGMSWKQGTRAAKMELDFVIPQGTL